MPWFPEFANAAELARQEVRAAGLADPVRQYFTALNRGDTHLLEDVWPGRVVVFDPRAGEVHGHHQLRRFVNDNRAWQAERHIRIETVAATRVGDRAVVELLAHLDGKASAGEASGGEIAWPVAVVAESPDDLSVTFRTYCSQRPLFGEHHLRPPILTATDASPADVAARYLAALDAGETGAIVAAFAPDGYLREPDGPQFTYRGEAELRALFARWFGAGGGIRLQCCAVTDDSVRCALEYNCVRWGRRNLAPQAGLVVCERGADGLLAAVRVYDDVARPRP
jgi:ketosteroid isomerase-like protein